MSLDRIIISTKILKLEQRKRTVGAKWNEETKKWETEFEIDGWYIVLDLNTPIAIFVGTEKPNLVLGSAVMTIESGGIALVPEPQPKHSTPYNPHGA